MYSCTHSHMARLSHTTIGPAAVPCWRAGTLPLPAPVALRIFSRISSEPEPASSMLISSNATRARRSASQARRDQEEYLHTK
jgi:hypothetical protein